MSFNLITTILIVSLMLVACGENEDVNFNDYYIVGSFGDTCRKGNLEKYLKDGGDPNIFNDHLDGNNLLMQAMTMCGDKYVQLLLEAGADKTINARRRGGFGERAIELAYAPETALLLLEYGADVNYASSFNKKMSIYEYYLNERGHYKIHGVIEPYLKKDINTTSKPERLFDVGSSVTVGFKNGSQCKAVVVTPGKENTKVEYTKWCETGFANSVSKGEEQWVPNSSITLI